MINQWVLEQVDPKQSPIAATLGAKPGNTVRPPPNDFKLTKWVNTGMPVQLIDLTVDNCLEILPTKQLEEIPILSILPETDAS